MNGLLILALLTSDIVCDADSDCFYVPESLPDNAFHPALIILNCTGATKSDIESARAIADSLFLILASCHNSRNHRDINKNDQDILWTHEKLVTKHNIDPQRVFIYGFSGMGVQALMALLVHPDLFRGAIAACAHRGALPLAEWKKIIDQTIFLISRTGDFNLKDNEYMHNVFRSYGVTDTLVIIHGEHSPASMDELLKACKWLLEK
jgi:hypothetical protein